jgi:energy-coupling factor transporter ATP-binding protein EcfA2
MNRIDTLHIQNFKFFGKQEPIKLGGKNLLLFGENGSGKSSVYWSLYTLFEASVKNDEEKIKKYFRHHTVSEESLINIHAPKITNDDGIEHYDSKIKISTTSDPSINYEVSLLDTSIMGNLNAVEVNQSSDFLNYKVLYKFQDFVNGEPIDLAEIFAGYILPYVKFSTFDIWRDGLLQPRSTAMEMWEEIVVGPGKTRNEKGKEIQVYKYSDENKQFDKFCVHFEDQMQDLIDFININAPLILEKLGYNIGFELRYTPHNHKKADVNYDCHSFKIRLIITSYLGDPVTVHRPHSFLNEAKITAIAIAIRLAVLRKRVNEEAPDLLKFIVFDDVMISLDMNNRDKLIDFLLDEDNKLIKDYQLIFLTHDKNLYDFVGSKIKKFGNQENWVFKEMYAGVDPSTKKEYPIIIDSKIELIDKAKFYYDAKDYTACSIYLRKELERIVVERLPIELKSKVSEKFIPLETLWDRMVERFNYLQLPVSKEITDSFKASKLHILNPQAHYQSLSLPVYKNELDKVFALLNDLEKNYPIPDKTLLINKESILNFKFIEGENIYSIKFELLTDFYKDSINGVTQIHYPKCKVITWSYNGNEFWDFTKNNSVVLPRPLEFNRIQQLVDLIKKQPLGITDQNFVENTFIESSVWSLRDVINKAEVNL